jgi:hypothetical protein
MSKTLDERLQDAKIALGKVGGAITRHPGRLPARVETQFVRLTEFASHVEHWKQMIAARETARSSLADLERLADENDDVPYGSTRAKFQTVRLLGVQAYLAAQWALADRVVGMSGQVLCIRNTLQDPKSPPQFVSHFVAGKGPESKTAAIVFDSLRQSFGWPIAISYALRNHFLHDGAGGDFFEGPTAASAFRISAEGWKRITDRVTDSNVDTTHSRLDGRWTPSAGDDLRKILDACAPEIDEALGILVGSACQMAVAHVGFMLGED